VKISFKSLHALNLTKNGQATFWVIFRGHRVAKTSGHHDYDSEPMSDCQEELIRNVHWMVADLICTFKVHKF
jgi:hypothetical protein